MREGQSDGGAGVTTFTIDGGGAICAEICAIPRPSAYSPRLTCSNPLLKSTSEDDFLNRNSKVDTLASPSYHSDRSNIKALKTESSAFSMSPWNQSSSSYESSPWTSHTPFVTSNGTFMTATMCTPAMDLFPAGTGLLYSLVREDGHIYSLATIGDLLYTGSDGKNIHVWKDQKEFSGFKSHSGLIKAIVIAADNRIFTGHQDGKIRIWKASLKNPQVYKRLGTLPRLKDFLKSSINPVTTWNLATPPQERHVDSTPDAVSCLGLDENERPSLPGSWDRTIKVWRLMDSRCLESVHAHDDAINSLVVGFQGLVFTGSADGTVKVWRWGVREGNKGGAEWHAAVETLLKQECAVTALAVNEEAGVLYTGSSDGVVNYFWRSSLARGGELTAHQMAVLCLGNCRQHAFCRVSRQNNLLVGEMGTGNHACLSVLTGHEGPVKCLAVVADGEEGSSAMGGV
ncbi:hypothetical protein HPP92_022702 [Vanilla planifolia]|uniref:Uncharacterized protein n=1 Tax=Vanilla planifolia TaxID=51239 RepID=A0A835PTR6_VANPL|nr:hypothetical protein HPP92_022702 [Vanilla planifolia]